MSEFTYNFHNKYFILFTFSLALEWSEDQNRLTTGSSHNKNHIVLKQEQRKGEMSGKR